MGCSPTSLEEYRREGESLCRRFTEELQKIETRDELLAALPNIRRRYEEFVDLMLEVKEFEEEHFGEATDPWNTSDFLASESLIIEMKRLYQLEGGRELMEKTQREALFRLDAALRR